MSRTVMKMGWWPNKDKEEAKRHAEVEKAQAKMAREHEAKQRAWAKKAERERKADAERERKQQAERQAQAIAMAEAHRIEQEEKKQIIREHVMVEKAKISLKYRIHASREEAATIPAMRRQLERTPNLRRIDASDPFGSRPVQQVTAHAAAPKALAAGKGR